MKYSVLMSVYYSDNAEYLKQAIDSMLNQTMPPDEMVLVCDGPLTAEVDAAIAAYADRLRIVRLKENRGLGEALDIGLQSCSNELVARMDSDDISLPDRCEMQLAVFEAEPEIKIVGGAIEEFSLETGEKIGVRRLPQEHRDIVAFSKKRCPFNHPSVMFQKSAVIAAGSYREKFHCNEDYDLWVRMLKNGCKSRNIPQTIVKMRVSDASYQRRGGKEYAKMSLQFYRYMLRIGWIGYGNFMIGALPQATVCVLPNKIRRSVYRLLRNK